MGGEQHNDHCLLRMEGLIWEIYGIRGTKVFIWRWLGIFEIEQAEFDTRPVHWDSYCDTAAALLAQASWDEAIAINRDIHEA